MALHKLEPTAFILQSKLTRIVTSTRLRAILLADRLAFLSLGPSEPTASTVASATALKVAATTDVFAKQWAYFVIFMADFRHPFF